MARLRAPGGCPWDREQTFDSIKPYTLEETYEVLEAIEDRDWEELKGELGDLLLQVLFYSEMAQEQGHFDIDQVLDWLSDKLVARHPHVFGDTKAETAGEVLRNWEALKKREKQQASDASESPEQKPHSVLDGISAKMPALMAAYKISSRAANVGFDWPNINDLLDKLHEEIDELKEELKKYPAPGPVPRAGGVAGARGERVPEELRERLEDEVGDLFFVLVNVARYLALDPESALRKTNRKFKQRFKYLEEKLHASGRDIHNVSLAEMENLWQESKKLERQEPEEKHRP